MVRLNWTEESIRWLDDIFEYIATDNPEAAVRVVQGIYQRAQRLAQFPHMGYRYDRAEREVRILLYGHYRIAYLVKPEGDVDILGVFHGALDITKYRL